MDHNEQVPSVVDEIANGQGLTLAQAAKRFPRKREGKAVAPSTVSRWALCGVRRSDGATVRLECVRWSRTVYTSEPAIKRFLAALAAVDTTPAIVAPATGRAAERQRAEEAEALRRLGL